MAHVFPLSVRRAAARVRAAAIRRDVVRRLRRLAASGKPVLAGPWLGEVGFELAYWIPFLRWAVETAGLTPSRVTAMSRGGVASWYRGVGDHYRDVLTDLAPDEFRRRNAARRAEIGEQKQLRITGFETDLRQTLERELGQTVEVLHPSLMYKLMEPYWWGHVPIQWAFQCMRFTRVVAPDPVGLELTLPESFIAVKFYFNDCLPRTPANKAFVRRTVDDLAAQSRVVLLSTGLALDDHDEAAMTDPTIRLAAHGTIRPETNLAMQTAVLSRAQRFVGTYGGFCYLAPLLGVDTIAYWSEETGFDPHHLRVIEQALGGMNGGRLETIGTAAARGFPI